METVVLIKVFDMWLLAFTMMVSGKSKLEIISMMNIRNHDSESELQLKLGCTMDIEDAQQAIERDRREKRRRDCPQVFDIKKENESVISF